MRFFLLMIKLADLNRSIYSNDVGGLIQTWIQYRPNLGALNVFCTSNCVCFYLVPFFLPQHRNSMRCLLILQCWWMSRYWGSHAITTCSPSFLPSPLPYPPPLNLPPLHLTFLPPPLHSIFLPPPPPLNLPPSPPPLNLPPSLPLQGEIIDRIEYNVETAAVHVDQGRKQLRQAVTLKRKSNRVS